MDEFEEIVGYHLEQAYRFLAELGHAGADPTRSRSGRRSGSSLPGAARCVAATAPRRSRCSSEPRRSRPGTTAAPGPRSCPDLGGALIEAGRLAEPGAVLADAMPRGRSARRRARRGAGARPPGQFLRLQLGEAAGNGGGVRASSSESIPVFRATGDEQGLCTRAPAARLAQLDRGAAAEAAARGVGGRRAGTPGARASSTSESRSSAGSPHRCSSGPTPVAEAIERCEAIRAEVEGNLVRDRGRAEAARRPPRDGGRFEEARRLLATSDAAFEELGLTLSTAVSHHAAMVEMLAGDRAAERYAAQGLRGARGDGRQGDALDDGGVPRAGAARPGPRRGGGALRRAERGADRGRRPDHAGDVARRAGEHPRAAGRARGGGAARAPGGRARGADRLPEPQGRGARRARPTCSARQRALRAREGARAEALELYEQKGNLVAAAQVRARPCPVRAASETIGQRHGLQVLRGSPASRGREAIRSGSARWDPSEMATSSSGCAYGSGSRTARASRLQRATPATTSPAPTSSRRNKCRRSSTRRTEKKKWMVQTKLEPQVGRFQPREAGASPGDGAGRERRRAQHRAVGPGCRPSARRAQHCTTTPSGA